MALKIFDHGDITRCPTVDRVASHPGTSPLEASSGNRNRRRLNTGGTLQPNTVLHSINICQACGACNDAEATVDSSATFDSRGLGQFSGQTRTTASPLHRHGQSSESCDSACPTFIQTRRRGIGSGGPG